MGEIGVAIPIGLVSASFWAEPMTLTGYICFGLLLFLVLIGLLTGIISVGGSVKIGGGKGKRK